MPDEPAIFISYRRRDAGGHGRALHEYLRGRFGDDRVFFDLSTIESGDVFPDKLRRGVEGCAVLLALIGPEWLDVRGDDGRPRLEDPHDFVRREIALALEKGKTVIPVLFDDTPIPPAARLPDPLKALASWDALRLRGKTYEYQAQRQELIRLLAKVPGVPLPRAEVGEVVPRQLPSDLDEFTGREREIAALMRALGGNGGGAAITAIGGMGGVGKTALAVHVAHRLAARYPDGQIVINLRGTETEPLSPSAAMGEVIFALAHKLPDDERALPGLYRSLLAGKRLLILLDNAADATQVRELLSGPQCAAIVTSRRAVVLPGLLRVPLDVLAASEADALLLRIIGEERASAAERALLAECCGYLPLALWVAGLFLKQPENQNWDTAEYLAALKNERERLKRLRIEGNALLDVAAVLGLSLRQLAHDRPELVERWRTLAVFAGSFDREAAAAVWNIVAEDARAGLNPLLERSILLFDAAKQRYRLHDLMRDLALGAVEPLSEEQERRLEEARDRHSAHYQRLLAEANGLFKKGGEGVAAGLARFDQERANIETGWRWLRGQAADDEALARRCRDYVAGGDSVLPLRQHPRERIEWLETALAAARRLHDRRGEGDALGSLGTTYDSLGELRRAIEYHEQSLAVAREIGDRRGEGDALGSLGTTYDSLGEYRRAIEYHEQSLAIAREIGDRRGEGAALRNLGTVYLRLGEYRRAIEYYEQGLAIAREIGDRRGEGAALGNLGHSYHFLGERRQAIEYYDQSLAIAREIGNRRSESTNLGGLGNAYFRLGEYRRAIEYYEQGLVIAREIGYRQAEAGALGNLGNIHHELGEYRRAIEYHEQASVISREMGDRQSEGTDLFNAARGLYAMGERDEAIARMQAAVEIYAAIDSPFVSRARSLLSRYLRS